MNVRAAAALALAPVLKKEASLQSSFEPQLSRVDAKDKALMHELVLGCLRQFEQLDALAMALLAKKIKAKDQDIYALILLGLYQLEHMRVPDHAAISETVSACKPLKKLWAKNLINAVLRNYQRERQQSLDQIADSPSTKALMPAWLLGKLKKQWPEHWQSLCENSSIAPPLFARVNTHLKPLDEAQAELKAAGIESEPCQYSAKGLRVLNSSDITNLPGFKEAWLSIQDEAAQLASSLLELEPGKRVLDACAAPGGKTAAIAEFEPALEQLLAIEIDESRIIRMTENLARLKIDAEVLCADAADTTSWWNGKPFDCILLDAPCSATGVIRRHPDIKLLRQPEDLLELAELQKLLLNSLWQTLAPGGCLLYATCSVLQSENEKQIAHFLEATPDAKEEVIDANWGEARVHGRQLFPQAGGHDGFYYAKLIKVS